MQPMLAKTNGRDPAPPSTRRAVRRTGPRAPSAERAPAFTGWLSSDEEEIERRRWRGRTEIARIEALERDHPVFGTFRVAAGGGGAYDVEIRSLDRPINACGCADHRVNGLGTCKHIEGALARLRRARGRTKARQGSPRVELFLARAGDAAPRLLWPAGPASCGAARAVLAPFLAADGGLADATPEGVATVLDALDALDAGAAARAEIRVSRYLAPWIDEARRRRARMAARERFLAEVEAGRQTFDVLRHKLLPYQREGMLHLAFGERALLADDMGLGKTVQAIAAAELLRRLAGVARVLVVSPASLKGEWQEQIARFSGAGTKIVAGPRAARLRQYAEPAFFTLVNYEQVVGDAADINRLLRPDIVVLDEAQRIKNWQTKTARMVKSLASRYAFVLTGTPIENRIDEIYSIVQYLEPGLLGPLFRFNRDFYALDERGRPVGYRNLDELMRRLKPVMLRRRKRDVETELPGRSVTNYLVAMDGEQRQRYDEYKAQAARLVQIAQRRPLTPKEFERLQRLLACMRMLCDTPYILDPQCRVGPKLEELERVLADLLAEPGRKVIVFSEWERMLSLARELAEDMGFDVAWHTGSVPQERRRAEIARFKGDPSCRLFLSTDSGGVGLNLQAASAVVNLDLPWNPARLEQRIARAWRKNQPRSVDVINLVTEDSIEHSMLQVLSQKQALADGVLDGDGGLKEMKLPSGRRAFVDRMAAMMAPPAAPRPAADAPEAAPQRTLGDEMIERHGDKLLLLERHLSGDGGEVLLAVLDDAAAAAAERRRLAEAGAPPVEVIDRAAYETIQRLSGAGLLQAAPRQAEALFRSGHLPAAPEEARRRRLAEGAAMLGNAERKLRMALLLAQGGFAAEAMPALGECLALADGARKLIGGPEPAEREPAESEPGELESAEAEPPETEPPEAPSDAPEQRPLDATAGSIERTLGDLRRSLRTLAAA